MVSLVSVLLRVGGGLRSSCSRRFLGIYVGGNWERYLSIHPRDVLKLVREVRGNL